MACSSFPGEKTVCPHSLSTDICFVLLFAQMTSPAALKIIYLEVPIRGSLKKESYWPNWSFTHPGSSLLGPEGQSHVCYSKTVESPHLWAKKKIITVWEDTPKKSLQQTPGAVCHLEFRMARGLGTAFIKWDLQLLFSGNLDFSKICHLVSLSIGNVS
jgi:hypothetical protein